MDERDFKALVELAGVPYTARMYESYTYLATAQATADSEVMQSIAKLCVSNLEKRAWMRAVV